MKHASEQAAGFWAPRPPALDAVIARLESLSLKPEFTLQREIALARALRPYLEASRADSSRRSLKKPNSSPCAFSAISILRTGN